jgi:hypothetical protein
VLLQPLRKWRRIAQREDFTYDRGMSERCEPGYDVDLPSLLLLSKCKVIKVEVEPLVLRLVNRFTHRRAPVEQVLVCNLRQVHSVDGTQVVPKGESRVDFQHIELAGPLVLCEAAR